jgi:REP-associated tyrosine transposase
MARLARVVVPGYPHHVTQRGNRRQETFFGPEDYEAYRALMSEWCAQCGVQVWAYCLMPNHVHLIAVPESEDSLRRAIGEAHRRYTRAVNSREGWRGHLWQGRFASFVMDEAHLLAAARYVELDPVRARLVRRPEDYLWSSARAHLAGADDELATAQALLALEPEWEEFLSLGLPESEAIVLRRHERTGRPAGSTSFVAELEALTGRLLGRQRPGPKRAARARS